MQEDPHVKSPTSLHGADELTPLIVPGPNKASHLANFWAGSDSSFGRNHLHLEEFEESCGLLPRRTDDHAEVGTEFQ